MGFTENLKLLFSKEKWRYSTLLVWLLLGVVFTQFLPIVGLIIFFPLLAFLMFLFLLSIISKKNIEDYPTWKIIVMLFLSIPIMLILIYVLFAIFLISIVIYFFLTSWFTVYGCYLSGKHIDEQIKKSNYKTTLQGLEIFGGLIVALFLLITFATTSIVYSTLTPNTPILLNVVYFIVGGIIIGFAIVCITYFFKKITIGWMGIFFILVIIYTFYLVLKIFLGLGSSGSSSSLLTKIGLLVFDAVILLYSMSLIIGSQAQILAERILSNNRYIQIDTIIIGLIFSKVSYEFAVNFPYDLLKEAPFLQTIQFIELIVDVGSVISLIRNIMVLIFYLLLLILVGIYQLRKYVLIEKSIKRRAEIADKLVRDEDLEEIIEVEKIEQTSEEAEIRGENGVEEIENILIQKFESERVNLAEKVGKENGNEIEKFNIEEKWDENNNKEEKKNKKEELDIEEKRDENNKREEKGNETEELDIEESRDEDNNREENDEGNNFNNLKKE